MRGGRNSRHAFFIIRVAIFRMFYSSDFNTTSFNWWMETTAAGGRATPEYGNATGFNRWIFTRQIIFAIRLFGPLMAASAGD